MATIDPMFEEIALEHLNIATLQVNGKESHDFREVYLSCLASALAAAYLAGRKDGGH